MTKPSQLAPTQGWFRRGPLVRHIQQRMKETAVSPIDFGALDESLLDVAVEGRESSDQKSSYQVVYVTVDRVIGEPKALTEL